MIFFVTAFLGHGIFSYWKIPSSLQEQYTFSRYQNISEKALRGNPHQKGFPAGRPSLGLPALRKALGQGIPRPENSE